MNGLVLVWVLYFSFPGSKEIHPLDLEFPTVERCDTVKHILLGVGVIQHGLCQAINLHGKYA